MFSLNEEKLKVFFHKLPLSLSGLIFIFLYTVGTFFIWYLKDPLKVVGAIFFGAYLSTLFIYLSEIINSFIFFTLSKKLGKEFVSEHIPRRFKNFYHNLGNLSLGWIFFLRAVPLIPYRVLDLCFGLSELPYKYYFLIVVTASLPRIFWIQFVLAAVKSLSVNKMILFFSQHTGAFLFSLFYFIVAFVLAFKMKNKFLK